MARPPLEWIFSNNVKVLDGFLNDMKLSMVQRQIDALVKAIGGYVKKLKGRDQTPINWLI